MSLIPYAGFDPTERHADLRIPRAPYKDDDRLLATIKHYQQRALLLREIALNTGVPLATIHEVVLADLNAASHT